MIGTAKSTQGWRQFGLNQYMRRLRPPPANERGEAMGAKTVTSSKTLAERTKNRSSPFKPNLLVIHRYIKWVSILTLLVVIASSVTFFIAYRVMGAKFDTDALTENDIPLAIGGAATGAGVGMALLSLFSPVSLIRGDGVGGVASSLMDEIELPEREDVDKKTKNRNTPGDDARRQAADEKMRKRREKARKRNMVKNKKKTRISHRRRRLKARNRLKGIRKAPKGVRFMRGFFRVLLRR